MRSLIGRFIIALLLVAAAVFARREAQQLRARADTLERFATLRVDIAEDVGAGDHARASYWRGAYDTLTAAQRNLERAADADVLLIAANAAFRIAEQAPQARTERLQQLDAVVQAYVSALKAPTFMPDAAYNYEYVVRLRDGLSRARANKPERGTRPSATTASVDLPSGQTIHGRPGGPPPETKAEEFEILTPMEYGDREAQPEPTSGVKPLRKG